MKRKLTIAIVMVVLAQCLCACGDTSSQNSASTADSKTIADSNKTDDTNSGGTTTSNNGGNADATTTSTTPLVPSGTAVESGKCGDNLTWTYYSDGLLMITGTGAMDDFTGGYYGSQPWDDYVETIQTVFIEHGATSIGKGAFYGQPGFGYHLTSVSIPSSVTSIGEEAFHSCGLTSITIPNGVTEIKRCAFGNTALTEVTIPSSVTSLERGVFWVCKSLTAINVDPQNANYASKDGVLFNKDCTTLVHYPQGKSDSTYTIPDGVTEVGYSAFANCATLTTVNIPDSVTSIGGEAFELCTALTDVVLPNSVTTIEKKAFLECDALTNIVIPSSVTNIEAGAFGFCDALTTIKVDAGNTQYTALDGVLCSKDHKTLIAYPSGKTATSYTIPNAVTTIGEDAFDGCKSLTSVTIHNGVKSIEQSAFSQYISQINYEGTKAEWNAIDKVDGGIIRSIVIRCTDGTVSQ